MSDHPIAAARRLGERLGPALFSSAAVGLLAVVLAHFEPLVASQLEVGRIGLLLALSLFGLGLGGVRPRVLYATAALLPLALLTLPVGTRSFAAAALPAALAALAAWRAAQVPPDSPEPMQVPPDSPGSPRDLARTVGRALPLMLGLLLAVQPLLRAGALLDAWAELAVPSPGAWMRFGMRLAGLPAVAALGAALLAVAAGRPVALAATLAAVLLGPGVTMHSCLALLAAGLGAALRPADGDAPAPRVPGTVRAKLLILGVVLAAGFALWEPRATLGAALFAIFLAAPVRTGAWVALTGAAVAWLAPAVDTAAGGLLGPAAWAWLGTLVPAALFAAVTRAPGRASAHPAAGGASPGWWTEAAVPVATWVALTAATLLAVPARGLLPALVLPATVVFALPAVRRAAARPWLLLEVAWLALLLVPASLAAAFPWLRPDPLEALAKALVGAPAPSLWMALSTVALAGALGLGAPGRAPAARGWLLAGATLAILLMSLPPRPETPGAWLVPPAALSLLPAGQAVALTPENPVWRVEVPFGRGAVAIETMLSNAAVLPRGTGVAMIRLAPAQGPPARGSEAALRAGRETGEWAARRPDLRALPGADAPPAHRHAFTENPAFLGQAYLTRVPVAFAGPAILTIERAGGTETSGVVVHLLRVHWEGAPSAGPVAGSAPAPPRHPFRGTLWALPGVGLLVLLVRRDLARRGARPPTPWAPLPWCLAGLVAAAWWHPRLGLPDLAAPIAAGFALLLLVAVARYVPALRRALGRRAPLPRRPAAAFFLLPLAVYLAILPWSTSQRPPDGDEPYYLLVAHSLAYDFDTDLRNNYAADDGRAFVDRRLEPQLGDPVGADGAMYSRHNELLPLVLALPYRLVGLLGALAVMSGLAAALAWLTLRLARHYAPAGPGAGGAALVAWALFAFLSPLLLFSGQVWAEVPAALLALVAIDHLLDLRNDRAWSRRRWLGIAAPIVLLPLLKLRFVLLAGPLVLLTAWHSRRPRRPLLAMAGLLGAVLAAVVAHNVAVFGNPLKIHSWEEVNPQGFTVWNYLHGLLGFFYDGAFGLFAYFPVWLLLLPALWFALRRRAPVLFDLAIVFVPYLVVVGRRREWFGGWSPPFRYALVALPLLAIALLPWLASRRRAGAGARVVAAGLAVATLALVLLWVVVPGWTYNIADGRTYLVDHLERRWGSDVGRLIPSSVRPRAAFWWACGASLAATAALLAGATRRRRLRIPAWALGGAGLLAAAAGFALLPVAARDLPTRTIEFEDPWVRKSGGHLHPDLWTVDRPLYRGGWTLRGGESASATVVPGGRSVALRVEARYVRNTPTPITLEARAGDRVLARWTPTRPEEWTAVDLGRHAWEAGDGPLVLAAVGAAAETPLAGLILDRLTLDWNPEAATPPDPTPGPVP